MSRLGVIFARLRGLVGRKRLEAELDDEIGFHLEMQIDDNIARGMSPDEARYAALRSFGAVQPMKEKHRDRRAFTVIETTINDMRYALRRLRKRPGYAAACVVTLALGIGASTAIFSLFDQLVLRKLAVPEPDRLVMVDWRGSKIGWNWGGGNLMSYPFCRDVQAQERFFDGVLCRHPTESYVSSGGRAEMERIEIVSGSYFDVLGARPEAGRLLTKSDDITPDANPVVVISYNYWKNRLGGSPDVVGRKLLINNFPMTVIGVAPASFRGVDPARNPMLWAPLTMNGQANRETIPLLSRRAHWLHIFGRLKSGIKVDQARAGLQPWFRSMLDDDLRGADFPRVTDEQRKRFLASTLDLTAAPTGLSGLRDRMKEPLWVLLGGTLLLLLLACVNVASLSLARGAARMGELTTRLALGASRGRVARQVLSESVVIALGGALFGVTVAPFIAQALLSFVATDLNPQLDYRVFLFASTLCLLTAALCGLIPAYQAGRIPLITSRTDRSRTAKGSVRLRKALVASQMAFTLILLIGVGLFVQTLARLQAKGPGFASSSLLMFRVSPSSNGYSEADATRVMREILARIQTTPGVESAAAANTHILTGGSSSNSMTIQSDRRFVTDRAVSTMRVGPGFFTTMGLQLLAGRDFDDRDVRPAGSTDDAYRSVIVSESFARRYFGDRNPVGYRVGMGSQPDVVTSTEIIGVVKGFTRRSLRDDSEQAFMPFWDRASGGGAFYARVHGDPEAAFASMYRTVGQVDPTLPVVDMIAVDEQIDKSLATERMLATLSSGFGVIALLLSAVGLYGVMSFVVTNRTREIGIRMALGASRPVILWLVARDAAVMLATGIAIALPCAWLLRRLVESQLYGVQPTDRITVAGAMSFLALVALAAAMLPARRAARIEPLTALRQD
jgi:predicted permease